MATDVRLLNTGIGLTRSFLELSQRMLNGFFDISLSGLDAVEARLPDIPLVSRPLAASAALPSALALPAARMRALAPGRAGHPGFQVPAAATLSQVVVIPPAGAEIYQQAGL